MNNCAFKRGADCRILYGRCMNPDSCRFRKTEEGVQNDRRKASLRLAALSQEQQKSIAEKYYHGRRVWCDVNSAQGQHCRWWHDSCFTCPWEDCRAGYKSLLITEEENENDYD